MNGPWEAGQAGSNKKWPRTTLAPHAPGWLAGCLAVWLSVWTRAWNWLDGSALDDNDHAQQERRRRRCKDPKDLLPQNGAPLRLAVPWKYGFKSIKAIVKIELVKFQPITFWMQAAPEEYGFYASVNPDTVIPTIRDIVVSAWVAEAELVDLMDIQIEGSEKGFVLEPDFESGPLRKGR